MTDLKLVDELIETFNLICQYSMKSYNSNSLNKREEIRYNKEDVLSYLNKIDRTHYYKAEEGKFK